MNRLELLDEQQRDLFIKLKNLYDTIDLGFKDNLNRAVSFGDVFVDRWERAKRLNFGTNSNIYDSSLVIGDVTVGANCWIGPYTILDGSGGLKIGNYVTISSGVHIYTHDNLKSTLTSGIAPIEKARIEIGSNTYIGPNSIISKGITIGELCVIGASSFVNKSIPNSSIVAGTPAKVIGKVIIEASQVKFEYFK